LEKARKYVAIFAKIRGSIRTEPVTKTNETKQNYKENIANI
jgi:hypothetical protein